jgi:hypothetical protein
MPASIVKKIADKYQGMATYREYANHAHKVILEPGWQDIAEDIDDWLKQVLLKS